MNNYRLFLVSNTCLFVTIVSLIALPIACSENTSIFGYPYYTTQAIGSGAKYDAHGSRFSLNNDADITSIYCLMDGGFSPTEPHDSYIYRFAVYSDDNGKVGTLISQTETDTFIGKVGGSQDVWNTANFSRALHLSSGTYWLMVVHNATQYITFNDEYPASNYKIVTSVINGMDFPATMNSPLYSQDFVLCIYASGTGASSVPEPVTNPNSQQVSRLLFGCTADPSSTNNRIQITGNLSANRVGIPSVPVLLSYAENPNATWHEIGTINTASDGTFLTMWYPTDTGSYVINATYSGDSTHTAETSIVNVIVTAAVDKSQTVFSVDSNSTVSNLGFNSQTNQLSFSVSGESGTMGYAQIYIAKSLVDDAPKIQASIDGEPANFTFSSVGDAWVLYFSYHHSSHEVVFSFNKQNAIAPTPTNDVNNAQTSTSIPDLTFLIFIVATVALLVSVLIIRSEKLKTKRIFNLT